MKKGCLLLILAAALSQLPAAEPQRARKVQANPKAGSQQATAAAQDRSKPRCSAAITTDAGITAPTLDDGAIDIDSNASCTPGPQIENMVWQKAPRPGRYLVYANLFDSCGLSSVRYNVLIRVLSPGDTPGTYKTIDTYHSSGSMLAVESNGGSQIGTFVTEFTQL